MSKAISTHPLPVACTSAIVHASDPSGARTWPGRAFLAEIHRWFATARRRRLAICELHRLSDERLSDIGIARGEIAGVVDALMAAECYAEKPYRVSSPATARGYAVDRR